MNSQSFAELLRQHRLALGLTQAQLAERAGLSGRGISDLERGAKQAPRATTVQLLVRALGLPDAEAAVLLRASRAPKHAGPETRPAPDRHNLPAQLTSFVGRDREVREVAALLGDHRLVTLTGAGGVGKTRLALEVAAEVMAIYQEGVWLVELAPLADPADVTRAVAAVLGLRERPGQSHIETLCAFVEQRRLLLLATVLDNLGLDAWSHGDFQDAEDFCKDALTRARSHNLPWVESQALYHLGLVAHDRMDLESAKEKFEQVLTAAQRAGDIMGIARAFNGLGLVAHSSGDNVGA
jgi:transcriptional regulator with XRE-family HTH domain